MTKKNQHLLKIIYYIFPDILLFLLVNQLKLNIKAAHLKMDCIKKESNVIIRIMLIIFPFFKIK